MTAARRLEAVEAGVRTRRARLMAGLAANTDIALGVIGSGGTLAAITIIWAWPWALLVGSLALIALAMVVPRWA